MMQRHAVNLAVLAAALSLCLVIAELVLRAIGFSFLVAPERIEFGWPDPEIIENYYEIDEDLFWVGKEYRNFRRQTAKRRPHIVFMGDSCTAMGTYPSDFGELVKQRRLEKPPRWARFGEAGYTSYQGLQQLRRDVLSLHPKVITFYYGWNDHWLGFGIEDKEIASLQRQNPPWLQKFRIGQLALKFTLALRVRNEAEVPARVAPKDFRKNLIQMTRLTQEAGALPVLLTAPTSIIRGQEPALYQIRQLHDLDRLVPLHEQYVEIVREVAREERVALCDLAAEFERLPQVDVTNRYFKTDGAHPSLAGNQKIAELLVDCFDEYEGLQSARWWPAAKAQESAFGP
jgi:lysophospholipase L1-like esterase